MAKWKELDIPFEEKPEDHGYLVFHSDVAGTSFRLKEVKAWVNSSNKSLELERDPDNEHDENAIKVIGVSKGFFFGYNKRHIGFVDRRTASKEIGRKDIKQIKVTLQRIAVLKNFYGGAKAFSITYGLSRKRK